MVFCVFYIRVYNRQANPLLFQSTQVRACVLYVEPSTRFVALSLRSYLVQPGTGVDRFPAGVDRVGEVVKNCKITSMHHMSGAMLELPDKALAFVHVSRGDAINKQSNLL